MAYVNIIVNNVCTQLQYTVTGAMMPAGVETLPPNKFVKVMPHHSDMLAFTAGVDYDAVFVDDEQQVWFIEIKLYYGNSVEAQVQLHGPSTCGEVVSRHTALRQLLTAACPDNAVEVEVVTDILGAIDDHDLVYLATHWRLTSMLLDNMVVPAYPAVVNGKHVRCWANTMDMNDFQYIVTDEQDSVIPMSKLSPKDKLYTQAVVLANNKYARRLMNVTGEQCLLTSGKDDEYLITVGDYGVHVSTDEYEHYRSTPVNSRSLYYYTWWHGAWCIITDQFVKLIAKAYAATHDAVVTRATALTLANADEDVVNAYKHGLEERKRWLETANVSY